MSLITRIYLNLWGVKVGSNLIVHSLPKCHKNQHATISIGNNVTILNKHKENLSGNIQKTILVANQPKANLIIGNNVGISGATLFCSNEIIIEDYVQIGANARIYDTDFHPVDRLQRRHNDKSAVQTSPVHICTDVWIGANSTILKGVKIGAGSIIATGSIVTKNVPPDTLVAGVPAQEIRIISKNKVNKTT